MPREAGTKILSTDRNAGGIIGEVAEYEAPRILGLTLTPTRNAG
jgi:hypothetical protein